MSAASTRQGQRGPRYRRRRPLPAIVLLVVLAVLSGFVWTRVFENTETAEKATRCNIPTASTPKRPAPVPAPTDGPVPTPIGKMLPRNGLNDTTPVPPQDVRVRVLNSNGEVNQATLVSKELTNLGFGKGGKAANDPVYTSYNLNCHGQIRFGGAGVSAARTLSLMAPCAQLVRDQRTDATVDFALGSEFDGVKTTEEAKQVLQKLKNWGKKHGQRGGAQQEVRPPPIDDELLSQARDVHC